MKKISKVISVLLTALLIMSQMCCVAFADEQVNVTITSNVDGLAKITNQIATDGSSTSIEKEGTYVQGGVITYTFGGTEMDPLTLTPDNIKITLRSFNGAETSLSIATSAVLANCEEYDDGSTEVQFGDDGKPLYTWKYQPYQATSTSYSISIADMAEGTMIHRVTFTDGVKTADGKSIVPVSKEFTTGRIATTKGYEGKVLKNVAYNKDTSGASTTRKITDFVSRFDNNDNPGYIKNDWVKIDLGNYYDIADVVLYSKYTSSSSEVWFDVDVAYSCNPEDTGDTANAWGTINKEQLHFNGTNYSAQNDGGRGYSQWLHPDTAVRARYIFLRHQSPGSNKHVNFIEVLAPVDCEYGAITATKTGTEGTATEFTGAGEYVVSVPVTEYVSGSSNGYMIVAGYDASGVITAINCAPVSKADGKLSLATTFNANTKTLKAVLIKDFSQPQMLTDALVLETPAQN